MPNQLPLLAQVADWFTPWGWNLWFASGLLAPLVGLCVCFITTVTPSRARRSVVATFYALALPLAGSMLLLGSERPLIVFTSIFLMPVGMIIGLVVALPRLHPSVGGEGRDNPPLERTGRER